MDPVSILAAVNGLAQLARAITPMAIEVMETMKSEDREQIDKALAELQAANDVLHARVQSKLRGT